MHFYQPDHICEIVNQNVYDGKLWLEFLMMNNPIKYTITE